ncbi:MAG: efflux RND transporter periplasmic adaptor subunit [Tannerella sp.]|jgi:membrane fusion protein (multidrug efflux system)|nr:efflux RND transporter periplasmic adaptor subunit [Tannerella sp.]
MCKNFSNKILFIIVLILLTFSCNNPGTSDSMKEVIPVMILEQRDMEVPQDYVADIHAVHFVEVRPKIEGHIEAIYVDEGRMVKKGATIFRLKSAEHNEDLKETEAGHKQALAKLKTAQYEVDRISRLVEKNIVAQIRLDKALAEKEAVEFEVKQAESRMQRSNAMLSYTDISAPFSGTISRIMFKVGSLVTPDDLLTNISDVSEMYAYFKLSEQDYLQFIKADDSAILSDSVQLILPDGSLYAYKGKIETAGSDFDRGTGSIAFRARFANPEGMLKHGISGKVQLTNTMTQVLLVPQKSTFEILDFIYVYTVNKEGKVQARNFKPLSRLNTFYVTKDLDVGSAIVYEGMQLVKDGMSIQCDTVSVSIK